MFKTCVTTGPSIRRELYEMLHVVIPPCTSSDLNRCPQIGHRLSKWGHVNSAKRDVLDQTDGIQ